MAYVRSERDEFIRRMTGIIREAKNDNTPSKDYSIPGDPSSTHSANLARLRELTSERLNKGVSPSNVLGSIVVNLVPPYKDVTDKLIGDFKKAGATDKDCIDALIESYDKI